MGDQKPGWVGSVTDLGSAMEVSRQTVHGWLKKPDFPQAVDGAFSVRLVSEWRLLRDQELERKRAGPAPVDPNSDDPLLNSGDSIGLERYRMAKAQLAEMDLAEREKVMLNAEAVHDGLAVISQTFRQACEELQRRFGGDAHAIIEQAITEAESTINDLFGPNIGDLASSESNPT